jgi:hypothetical protein
MKSQIRTEMKIKSHQGKSEKSKFSDLKVPQHPEKTIERWENHIREIISGNYSPPESDPEVDAAFQELHEKLGLDCETPNESIALEQDGVIPSGVIAQLEGLYSNLGRYKDNDLENRLLKLIELANKHCL